MLKKRNAVIVGLTSITLFTGCLALINNSDNKSQAIAEAFSQTSNPPFSDEAMPTGQGQTTFFPPVPLTTNAETVPKPEQPTEQPSVTTPDIKNNVSQTPTESIPPSTSQTPSPTIKVTPPTTSIKVVPPTTPKTTTTKTRAS